MNKHIANWSKTINEAKNMLNKKDFESFSLLMNEANSIYEKYKRECDLTYKCKNFGLANHIFEEALPKLFKKNKNAVKEFMTTIKEDKNLSTEFKFIKALNAYNPSLDAKEYVNECLEIASNGIDRKTLNESNKKLASLIEKYEIRPNDFIAKEKVKMFEDCDYLLKNNKKLTNLTEHNTKFNSVVEYTKNNVQAINENKTNIDSLIEGFNKKYNNLLNEEEKSLVKDIMDFRAPQNESKKMALFNKFKNECISTVDKLIESATDEEKVGLNAIKEQIEEKVFCSETLVGDLAKLLEIRDVLLDS